MNNSPTPNGLMIGAINLYPSSVVAAAGYCFFLGGSDALAGTAKATFKAGLGEHWSLIKSAVQFPLGRAIDIVPMGARTAADGAGGTDASVENIRQACLEWVAENNAEAGIAYGWPDVAIVSDGVHQDGAGARTMGSRYALTAQKRLGLRTADARGPVLETATRASNLANVVLSVRLNGGTALVKRNPAAATDGIEVFTARTTTTWPVSNVTIGAGLLHGIATAGGGQERGAHGGPDRAEPGADAPAKPSNPQPQAPRSAPDIRPSGRRRSRAPVQPMCELWQRVQPSSILVNLRG